MGSLTQPLPVKLFVGILTSLPETIGAAEEHLSERYGRIDSRSVPFPFDWTAYYDETMGKPIFRYFLGFENLVDPSSLAEIKIVTNNLETQFASQWSQVRRPINLDPGYLEESKLVLASTKNFYHRIFLSGGIYAEVTLHYERGGWRTLPWTFPDYASEAYHAYFGSLRNIYRDQIKGKKIRQDVR
jgi:hypothetical protein